jgi:cupin domain
VRRVVTGVAASGKAVFVSDGPAEVLGAGLAPPGVELIWGSDAPPAIPSDGSTPEYRRFFPPMAGFRVVVAVVPPDSAGGAADTELMPRLDEEFVGLISDAEWDPDTPGMHRTPTIDIGLILEGRVVLELDGGESRELGAGDWYIQNGTRHVWRNPWETPCKVAIVFIGAAEG